jgi:hypothetical protein
MPARSPTRGYRVILMGMEKGLFALLWECKTKLLFCPV